MALPQTRERTFDDMSPVRSDFLNTLQDSIVDINERTERLEVALEEGPLAALFAAALLRDEPAGWNGTELHRYATQLARESSLEDPV